MEPALKYTCPWNCCKLLQQKWSHSTKTSATSCVTNDKGESGCKQASYPKTILRYPNWWVHSCHILDLHNQLIHGKRVHMSYPHMYVYISVVIDAIQCSGAKWCCSIENVSCIAILLEFITRPTLLCLPSVHCHVNRTKFDFSSTTNPNSVMTRNAASKNLPEATAPQMSLQTTV